MNDEDDNTDDDTDCEEVTNTVDHLWLTKMMLVQNLLRV